MWKFLTSLLAGMVITLVGCMYQQDQDRVRQSDIAVLQRELDQHTGQLASVNESLLDLHTSMGEVKGALGVKH